MVGRKNTYAIVQFQIKKFKQGEKVSFGNLINIYQRLEGDWEDVTKEINTEINTEVNTEVKERQLTINIDIEFIDTEFITDCYGVVYSSVGDWAEGYNSLMVVLQNTEKIQEIIGRKFENREESTVSFLTLWEGFYWVNHDGEGEADYSILGEIDPHQIASMLFDKHPERQV